MSQLLCTPIFVSVCAIIAIYNPCGQVHMTLLHDGIVYQVPSQVFHRLIYPSLRSTQDHPQAQAHYNGTEHRCCEEEDKPRDHRMPRLFALHL
jgi:hypothetical protein